MTTPKRIQVEIGVPSQIEPGQEVEIESVPGIMAARMRTIKAGDLLYVGGQKGIVMPADETGEIILVAMQSKND